MPLVFDDPAGDSLTIRGRLVLANTTAVNLADYGLSLGFDRALYNNSYIPVTDFVSSSNQTLIPSMDLWGAIGIPLPKYVIDTIQTTSQQQTSFNQEKARLETQLSTQQSQVTSLQNRLSSTQETVTSLQANYSLLQSQFTSAQKSVSSLQTNNTALLSKISDLQNQLSSLQGKNSVLQFEVSGLTNDRTSIQSQLGQTQYMLYGSVAAAVVLLAVTVVLATRKRK